MGTSIKPRNWVTPSREVLKHTWTNQLYHVMILMRACSTRIWKAVRLASSTSKKRRISSMVKFQVPNFRNGGSSNTIRKESLRIVSWWLMDWIFNTEKFKKVKVSSGHLLQVESLRVLNLSRSLSVVLLTQKDSILRQTQSSWLSIGKTISRSNIGPKTQTTALT